MQYYGESDSSGMQGLVLVIMSVIAVSAFTRVYFMEKNILRGIRDNETKIQAAKEAGLELKVGDINGNSIPESYYLMDGTEILVTLDGEPIEKRLKKRFLVLLISPLQITR